MNITPINYAFLVQLLKNKSGQVLLEGKDSMIKNRFSPLLIEHKIENVNDLLDRVRMGTHRHLESQLVEAMAVHETYFFRDIKLFDLFKDTLLRETIERNSATKSLKIWSAACSTGQEIYSITMILEELKLKFNDWSIKLLGTDFSTKILQQAKQGIFSQFEVQRGLPIAYLVKYFEQQQNLFKLKDHLKDKVVFKFHNLTDCSSSTNSYNDGPYDFIFCRNVLIYFDVATKKKIMEKMIESLAPEGYIIIGASETIMGVVDSNILLSRGAGIYQKKP